MIFDLGLGDIRLIAIGIAVFVGFLVVWAVLSSFVSVVNGVIINEDKKSYNELVSSYKSRFQDIYSNENYTEVKRQYLLGQLVAELEKLNKKTQKKYLGSVVKETAVLYNIETYPGDVPNNVYLKLPAGDSFIWCVFNDTKNKYINFDKGEEVEIDGVVDRINLLPSRLPPSLDYNIDKFFRADFAVHLKDDAKMRKVQAS